MYTILKNCKIYIYMMVNVYTPSSVPKAGKMRRSRLLN